MKDTKLCVHSHCKRKRRIRNNKPSGRFCSTHDKANWRAKFPMKAAFQTLRQNCRRRGIFFDLNFGQFAVFCYETDYMRGKGRTARSYSIDRIIEGKLPGYTMTNIRKITVRANILKEHRRRKSLIYDYRHPEYTTVV